MSLKDYKISAADFVGNDISSLPDNPSEQGYNAAQLKERFDCATKNIVTPKHNSLIEKLTSSGGAAEIGSSGGNIQEELDAKINQESVTQILGNAEDKIPSEKAVVDALTAGKNGDMLRAVYDTNQNGIVDNAEKLGGYLASQYARWAGGAFTGAFSAPGATFVEGVATPLVNILANDGKMMGVRNTSNSALDVYTNQAGGVRLMAPLISCYDYTGANFSPIAVGSVVFGGTVSIQGKSGAQDALILQGGNTNSIFLRGPNVRIRNSADTDYVACYGASFTNPSSLRYKHAIELASDKEALDLLHINIKNYIYNEGKQDKVQIGVIAEEIDAAGVTYPITYDAEGRPDGVDYSKFVPALIKLCQMQQAQIDDMASRLKILEEINV